MLKTSYSCFLLCVSIDMIAVPLRQSFVSLLIEFFFLCVEILSKFLEIMADWPKSPSSDFGQIFELTRKLDFFT